MNLSSIKFYFKNMYNTILRRYTGSEILVSAHLRHMFKYDALNISVVETVKMIYFIQKSYLTHKPIISLLEEVCRSML